MRFAFTEEQQELRRQARALLAEHEPSWQELAELGWLGVSVPEELGGAGLGFVEEAVVIEELGRVLSPQPYLATVGLALPALPGEEQARVAAGEARWSASLDGSLVPDLDKVERVVTAEGEAPAEGEVLATVDETRTLGRLAPGPRRPLPAPPDRARAFAALAVEAVGVAGKALDLAVEHAKTREQFGRPIGTFQAVSHQIADVYVRTELARSLAYWAAWCVAVGDGQAPLAACAAKAYAAEAAVAACERSIQVHGGIGFTWEHPLHRYYKRALWIEAFGGYPAEQRAEIARALLG